MKQCCQNEMSKILEPKLHCIEYQENKIIVFSYLLIIRLSWLPESGNILFCFFWMITSQNCQKDQISFKVLNFVTKFGSTSSPEANVNTLSFFLCVFASTPSDVQSLRKSICFTFSKDLLWTNKTFQKIQGEITCNQQLMDIFGFKFLKVLDIH